MLKGLMWHAAFDYVRLTYGGLDAEEVYQEVYKRTVDRVVAAAADGEVRTEPWAWLGYRGVSSGVVQAGSGPQGALLQGSGWAAAAIRELDVPWTGCPRCDIQVTIWYSEDPGKLPERFATISSELSRLAGARKWRVSQVKGYGNGDTAYLGARTSDKFIRIYDKGRQSPEGGDYENALRYEVELKNEPAAHVWAGESKLAPSRDWVASQVRSFLRDKGVYLALPDALASPEMWRTTLPKTSNESRLAWLRNQVAPSLEKLMAQGVTREHILDVLGLT